VYDPVTLARQLAGQLDRKGMAGIVVNEWLQGQNRLMEGWRTKFLFRALMAPATKFG
jgi:hypothetical protein